MFEKEAEEYLDTESKYLIEDNEGNIINIAKKVKQSFQDGAEFGYNKANEWHYVKDGEYPTHFGMINAKHIECIGEMQCCKTPCWDSDITAAQHAEKYEGIKIIRDIKGLYKVFLDTPENREKIMKQLEELK